MERKEIAYRLGPNATQTNINHIEKITKEGPKERVTSEIIRLRNGYEWGPWRK